MGVENGEEACVLSGLGNGEVGASQYDYRSLYSLKGKLLSPVAGTVFETFSALPAGSWVLDLGGGDGRFPDNAPKPRSFRFLGVELSPEAVAQYKDAIAQDGRLDEAIVGDITRLADLAHVHGRDIRGAVSWRVIHSLNSEQQRVTLNQLGQILPVGAPVFLAVYSDSDWKARELQSQGRYNPDDTNNCADIMRLGQSEFNLSFFNPRKLVRLAEETGFIPRRIIPFEEPTGYGHLRPDHPSNRYLLVHLERG